jgi:uncharacterized membrane protein (DUF373 family)
MTNSDSGDVHHSVDTNSVIRWLIIAIEYAIVASLMLVAAIVLVRSLINFLDDWNEFPKSVVSVIDGILVVIILLDIAHTVFGHLRASVFPVRPFLIIGILAGVRDILSSSAHLALGRLPRHHDLAGRWRGGRRDLAARFADLALRHPARG